MKNYREMADSVLARRDEYVTKQKRQRKAFGAMAACLCLALLAGVGAWRGGLLASLDIPAVETSDAPEPLVIQKVPARPEVEDLQGESVGDRAIWISADELVEREGDGAVMGFAVPTFLSHWGNFYGIVDYDVDAFGLIDDEVELNPKYRLTRYMVQGHPDCIAVHISGIEVYEKIFDVTFQVDGVTYGIEYSPVMDTDYAPGGLVLEGDGFTVYQAVKLQGEPADGPEYLVNILPLLKEYRPTLFGDDSENYAEAWQIALPLPGFAPVEDVPVQGEAYATGALTPYEEVWGGSYMDSDGTWVILLTEDTAENRAQVLALNPGLNESNTLFQSADYSLAYLTEVMANISDSMGRGDLPSVTTAALREERNRVQVTMTTEDPDSAARVLAFDPTGGAIELDWAVEPTGVADLELEKNPQT